MRFEKLPLFRSLAIGLLATAFATAEPLAKKGELILSNNFDGSLDRHEQVNVEEGWFRRISYGDWALQKDGSLIAVNVPEHGHGPVMTFNAPIRDIIIECEFKLPKEEGPDRHFRIFLDNPDYRGHNIQSTANVSSTFRPTGLTLQHLEKDKEGKTVRDVEFGLKPLMLEGDTWYKMTLEIVGSHVRTVVNGITLEGTHPALDVEKSKIGLNPGKAGGALRNFRAWAVAKSK
jgi:hypothetical protein